MSAFDPAILSPEDLGIAVDFIRGGRLLRPDLVIAPDGKDYLYRWFIIPRDPSRGEVYFHVQVASDPERPLHDHPWDNQSVILSGGYEEVLQQYPPYGLVTHHVRRPGDVIQRKAREAHRLILPDGIPYTMSIFTTGPEVQDWGFWEPSGSLPAQKISHHAVTEVVDGKSIWKDKR